MKVTKTGARRVVVGVDIGGTFTDLVVMADRGRAPATHKILKKINYRGCICIDHHYTPVSPRHSFGQCREYIRTKLEHIYS